MKYYEVDFNVLPLNSDAADLLAALAGEAGFETFEETDHGLRGYVQQPQFDRSLLDSLLQTFPMPGVTSAIPSAKLRTATGTSSGSSRASSLFWWKVEG